MTQANYTVDPQGKPLAVMVSIATLEQALDTLQRAPWKNWRVDQSIDALRAALANAERVESKPTFTTGHCKEKQKPGGCQLHNLQCGYPKCDRGPTIDLGRYAGTYGGYITKATP